MAFIMEFAQHLVLKIMEDPEARDRKSRAHTYQTWKAGKVFAKTINNSIPMRPYGFWTFERHNSQLAWDRQISNVPGRRDPYDEVLAHYGIDISK